MSLAHAVMLDRPAALLGAPLPAASVAMVVTQLGWIAAAAVLLAVVRARHATVGLRIGGSGSAVRAACSGASPSIGTSCGTPSAAPGRTLLHPRG